MGVTVHGCGWHLFQLEVNNALLNGDLVEEVYTSILLGYRQWFTKFSTALLTLGFIQSQNDYSLFTRGSGDSFAVVLVYVDDIVLAGPFADVLNQVKLNLQQHFKLKDLGVLRYFHGLEIAHSAKGIVLNQCKYVLTLLDDTGFLGSKPVSLLWILTLS